MCFVLAVFGLFLVFGFWGLGSVLFFWGDSQIFGGVAVCLKR
ncbi:hypothetical protein HMPREF9244_00978 [Alloscardovia omnicolens F0580]|uniref:Uncharacterized protein n=1 Tax=Alloscardovia omnicolens F0580 TaxID=1321816 RepID=U1SEX1_9BIFI|nr:hypothetical protein HMPREF9244_00978 [Alloscardovia omnicolens F0580]